MTAVVPPYRIDWWSPLRASPGEWAGRWELACSAEDARAFALSLFGDQPAMRLVLLTLSSGGAAPRKVVVDLITVERWRPAETCLPLSAQDSSLLPPRGNGDIEHLALVHCKDALRVARDAGLLEPSMVMAIVEIVQQAFSGTGPASEVAALIRRETKS